MRKLLLSLIFVLLAFAAHGQEQDDPVSQEEPSPAEQDTGDEETIPTERREQSESFVPSEIISEDLSVPFPVDI